MEEGAHGHHPVPHTAPYLQGELRGLPTLAKVKSSKYSQPKHHGPCRAHALLPIPVLQELLAGGVAGGLSKTSVAPLERIKILFQVCGISDRFLKSIL